MQAYFVIKSSDLWYAIPLEFRAQPTRIMPILESDWTRQDAADVIVNTCGSGVKMVFQNLPKQDGSRFGGMSGWHDGDQFDHSPDWSNSPINPMSSKMVSTKYWDGQVKSTNSFETKELASSSVNCVYLYIWDGTTWTHQKTENRFKKTNTWKANSRK